MVQLTPRYVGPPVIDVASVVPDPSAAVVRQRDRLADALGDLSSEQWAVPSRCAGWSVQDVAEHLVSVNRFWIFSIGAGLRGEPTQLLADFDPVTVPAALVESARGASPATTLEKLQASNAELASLLQGAVDSDWAKPAEAPPGHIALGAVCAHALWDAWVHERDVLFPLGRHQQLQGDEVAASLAYAAALAPALYVNAGEPNAGSLAVRAHDPELAFTVEIAGQVTVHSGAARDADAVVDGDAVSLVEALSGRAPLPPVADQHRWLVDGLHRAFGIAC